MSQKIAPELRALLRKLPAVDELAKDEKVAAAARNLPAPVVTDVLRQVVDDARHRLLTGVTTDAFFIVSLAVERIQSLKRLFLNRVINATGVVLHTNLGRAPLSDNALRAVQATGTGYTNLEFEIESGRRGSRDVHGETLLTKITGAEAALIVNNNAAAVLLVLSALASGREVILSRGEMIEIGGAFRIPEVMEQSGCILREVGTTNRTHLHDYERAIGEETAAILKVHPSNYRIVGFTAGVDARRLAPLARRHRVPLIEDLGSGVVVDTTKYGLAAEPTVQQSIAAGVDVVTFSGDKLLGGPQAGIIVGRRDFVDKCRRHPLARALRVDKLTLAALQATLIDYLQGNETHIPIYAMLSTPVADLRARAERIRNKVLSQTSAKGNFPSTFSVRIVDSLSTIGGGSLPEETLESVALALKAEGVGAAQLASALRLGWPPVVGRIEGDCVLLDLRTVHPDDDETVSNAIGLLLRSQEENSPTEVTPCTS